MSLMLISSSFSETGFSTFSLANFFPFSTSSLLSFSKCSRNLRRKERLDVKYYIKLGLDYFSRHTNCLNDHSVWRLHLHFGVWSFIWFLQMNAGWLYEILINDSILPSSFSIIIKRNHLFGSCLPPLLFGWWFILLISVVSLSEVLDRLSPPPSTLALGLLAPEPGSPENQGSVKHHLT